MWCPIARQDCRNVDCTWFHEGECAVVSLSNLVEKLEDVTDALKEVKREIGGIVSAM
jgi:hypothetical protein